MPYIRSTRDRLSKPPDGQNAPPRGHLPEKRRPRQDFLVARAAVRSLRPRMGRDDVPAEGLDPQLGEDAPDDRRRRLGRAAAGELPLGGERDPRDARSPVPGGFSDEQEPRAGMTP